MASRPPGEPQAFSLFDTPVILDRHPEAEALNAALKPAILARMAQDGGVAISNVGGWHSDKRMLEWGGESARALARHLLQIADRFTVDIRAEGKPRYRWAADMWANVNPPGASNQYHAHPGCFWSAIYYVDDGYAGSSDKTLGGELLLMDPRMPTLRMNNPDLRFRRPGGEPEDDEKLLRPETGRIVLFPAWLSHAVRPYRGTGQRISIALNVMAAPIVTGQ